MRYLIAEKKRLLHVGCKNFEFNQESKIGKLNLFPAESEFFGAAKDKYMFESLTCFKTSHSRERGKV